MHLFLFLVLLHPDLLVIQGVFHQHGQAINTAAEVDRVPTEVHRGNVIGGTHHGRVAAVFSTNDNVAASTLPSKETAVPLGS